MDKKEFFEKIKETYFEELTCDFEDFKTMLYGAIPVFGELETKITEKEDEKIIVFRDIDSADAAFVSEGYKLDESDLDMSGTIMTLTLDKDNVIKLVENNAGGLFTKANKDIVLFLGSLIGKKIKFK